MKLKFWGSYALTLLFTLILLEVSSFFLFQSLTEREFTYAAFQNERLARIAAIQKRLQTTKSQELYKFHPYLGYVGRPGAYPWGKGFPPFNEYGMLSITKHPYPYKKGNNEFVVAVVGGSVAEIFANDTEKLFNQHLHERFGFEKKLVFVNLATGGYKQPQQLFHVQYALLAGFEFDAILNIDGFNDLALANDNINNQINPIFPSGHHIGLMSKTQMTNQLDFQTTKHLYAYYNLYETELGILSFTQSFPFKYSIFFNLLAELWMKRSLIEIKQAEYKLAIETQKTMSKEFRGPLLQNGSPYEMVANIWQQASEMLYAISQANRLIYIHVLQPNQYVEGSKPLSDKEKKIALDLNNSWSIAAREGYVHLISKGKQLKTKGIPFYDLSMIFKDSTEDFYVDACCHFNINGNILMGKNIAEILLRELQKQKF